MMQKNLSESEPKKQHKIQDFCFSEQGTKKNDHRNFAPSRSFMNFLVEKNHKIPPRTYKISKISKILKSSVASEC